MTDENRKTLEEARIRRLLEDWTHAVRSKDINRILSHYTDDILSFDLAPPLEYRGAAAYRKNWEEWAPTFEGPIGYEIHHLRIFADEDSAFSHSLNRITGNRTDGEKTDVWIRSSIGYRKVNAEWKIAHDHFSVPFDMVTYKAMLNLKP